MVIDEYILVKGIEISILMLADGLVLKQDLGRHVPILVLMLVQKIRLLLDEFLIKALFNQVNWLLGDLLLL